MGFKCGIVGLPNVGKSTLFNSLTKAGIAAENYPFCTIDPNVGIVEVPDPRLRQIADIVKPKKILPTTMEFVDIAGLVAGASKGEGLGNQFLGHIRETDAIAQVVRCFEDEDIAHVANRIDPLSDIETINTELLLADMESIARQTERAGKLAKSNEKEARAKYEFMLAVQAHVEDGLQARSFEVADNQRRWMKELHLKCLRGRIREQPTPRCGRGLCRQRGRRGGSGVRRHRSRHRRTRCRRSRRVPAGNGTRRTGPRSRHPRRL